MTHLSPETFFDLEGFAHRALFKDLLAVWEALPRISAYIQQFHGSMNGTVSEGAFLVNKESIFMGKGSLVEPGAYIQGPCIIGEGCEIRHGAYIRGNVILGDRAVVGHATEVKNSVFLNHAVAAHLSYVGDSILGHRTNLGAGTKCANLRFDEKPITLSLEGTLIHTGLRKLGLILGDESQTGCNSVTNPGTLIGKGLFLYPGAVAQGFITTNKKRVK